jgi:hypothetical protein
MARRGYAKLSNDFYMSGKVREIRAICPSALGVYAMLISYASDRLTDGTMDKRDALYLIGATDTELDALCAVGLLVADGDEGYAIHDYLDYQQSRETVQHRRDEDLKRQSKHRDKPTVTQPSRRDKPTVTQPSRRDCGVNTRTQEPNKDIPPSGGIQKNPPEPDSGEYSQPFEQFWAVYPWQTDKPGAYAAFRRSQRKTNLTTLIAAAQRYAAWLQEPDAPHCMKPGTWLDRESWLDHPQPKRKARASPGNWPTRTDRATAEWQQDAEIYRNLKAQEGETHAIAS